MTLVALLETKVCGYPQRRGKVRDIYDLGDRLVIIATDRISAFDWVLPNGIPEKGKVLTELTLFWLNFLDVPNHLISTDLKDLPKEFHQEELIGRTMLVKKTEVVPVECVARGYLAGSGWKEYQQSQTVCGIQLPSGLLQAEQLPEAIFTPTTKAEAGHDEAMTWDQVTSLVGESLAESLRTKTLDLYQRAAQYARSRGILIADTKFEWGQTSAGELILIDEVLTPDSSRFWPEDQYKVGKSPISFDKQFVRDWLESTAWDKNSPPPELPPDIVGRTRDKYREALQKICG